MVLYRIRTYWYRDRYKVLIERRTVLYVIGTIKSWVRDFWYGILVYRIKDWGEWYSTVRYRIELGRTSNVTTTFGLCILLKVGGKSKCDLLSAAGKIELIFCFTAHNELIFCFVGLP